jgi:glycosyltransferase involved in cell wall biosynthesis
VAREQPKEVPMDPRPRIALFDYEVTEQSPTGSCHLHLLRGLADEFAFTVFATRFDNPRPDAVRYVPVPAITRPAAARYVSYYASSSARFRWTRADDRAYDLVQAVEGYTLRYDVSYVHFCHRAYLHRESRRASGLRGRVRALDHQLRAVGERRALHAAGRLVVPSSGLLADLEGVLGLPRDRVRVIPNPVDLDHWVPPPDFDRSAYRRALGAADDDLMVAFVALGHFERKGLPFLLGAVAAAPPSVRLVVIGGGPDLLRAYRARAAELGIASRVRFAGMQTDVRPYLWASDVLAAPSSYEVFALAPLQAAAAGLPLLVTAAPGVAPFFRDGEHGRTVQRDAEDIADALEWLRQTRPDDRRELGAAARRAVTPYGVTQFVQAWRSLYREELQRRADARSAA